jgi:hypothetical protein
MLKNSDAQNPFWGCPLRPGPARKHNSALPQANPARPNTVKNFSIGVDESHERDNSAPSARCPSNWKIIFCGHREAPAIFNGPLNERTDITQIKKIRQCEFPRPNSRSH